MFTKASSLPQPDRDYEIPTGVQYTLSVHEDKGGDVIYGDANGDGNVDILDAAAIQQAANERITLTEDQALAADVNGDGKKSVYLYPFTYMNEAQIEAGIKEWEKGHTLNKIPIRRFCMRKSKNTKIEKVPRLTEAEYAAYINALKEEIVPQANESGDKRDSVSQGAENG